MTTVNHDYHAPRRGSLSPRLAAPHDARSSTSQASHADAWTVAFQRLQDQVHYNTTMIEDQRRHLADLHDTMKSVHADLTTVWRQVDSCKEQIEFRLDRGTARPERQDVDLLMQHLQTVDRKASEVNHLRIQLDLMTQRLRRLEDVVPPPCGPTTVHPMPQHLVPEPSLQQQNAQQHPHVAPASEDRHPVHTVPAEEHKVLPKANHHDEHRRPNTHATFAAPAADPRSLAGFRALDTPAVATSWRPASSVPIAMQAPLPSSSTQHHASPPSSGWAAVNSSGLPTKRPASIDAGHRNDASAPGSPKRQKLATLMPRSSVAATHQAPHPSSEQASYTASPPAKPALGENPSEYLATASQATGRFIPFPPTAEAVASQQEAWRHEHEHGEAEAARGSRGGSRGKGQVRKSRSLGLDDADPRYHHDRHAHTDWAAVQAEGYYRPQHAYSQSPQEAHSGREHPSGHYEGQYMSQDGCSSSFSDSGKKSRTKPTRNANGVLIRKDGRPDMRSVSSAQNLRKVHAKKEAERNGDTPTAQNDPASATSSDLTGHGTSADDKSSVVDGSNAGSPVTPTTESLDNDGSKHRTSFRGFASINDDRHRDLQHHHHHNHHHHQQQQHHQHHHQQQHQQQQQQQQHQQQQQQQQHYQHAAPSADPQPPALNKETKRERSRSAEPSSASRVNEDVHMAADPVMSARPDAHVRENRKPSVGMGPRLEPAAVAA